MITVIAIICSLADASSCREQVVTTSNFAEISMTSCLMGAPQLAKWMADHPGYRLAGWRCEFGKRERRGA